MNKHFYLILLTTLLFTKSYSQSIINGDFENNSGSCLINITNANYNQNMFNSTAFGTFENLDIVDNSCGYGLSQSGQYCIFMAVSNVDSNFQEAISFDLSAPLQTGISYTLTFYARVITGFSTAPIKIGVSFSDSTFGNLIGFIPASLIASSWTLQTINFVSPINANYLTVTVGGPILNSGNALDNFQLNVSTGFNNLEQEVNFLIAPSPFSEYLNISLNSNEVSEIIFYDLTSRKVLKQQFTGSALLNTDQLAKGIYVYELRNKGNVIRKGKVVKD